MDHAQLISLSQKVRCFMETHGVGIILASCHLITYPNDTHYCSGHGLYGDNTGHNDCCFKEYCREIAERSKNEP